MQFSLTAGPGVGEENGAWLAEDPAFRRGHGIRGIVRPDRNAGSPPYAPGKTATGVLIAVTWSRDESWPKQIRVLSP